MKPYFLVPTRIMFRYYERFGVAICGLAILSVVFVSVPIAFLFQDFVIPKTMDALSLIPKALAVLTLIGLETVLITAMLPLAFVFWASGYLIATRIWRIAFGNESVSGQAEERFISFLRRHLY